MTPQLMMALVPLMTLWSCGGSVIRVLAAGGQDEALALPTGLRGGISKGQPSLHPSKAISHGPEPIPGVPRELHPTPGMVGGSTQLSVALGRVCPAPGSRARRHGCAGGCLTPDDQVGRRLVHAAGVGGQAGVGAGVVEVRRAHEEAARLQQREARQLHRAAGQDPLPWVTRGAASAPSTLLIGRGWWPRSSQRRPGGHSGWWGWPGDIPSVPNPFTFLPRDGRARSPRGLAVEDDGHAVNHRAVLGTPGDVGGDACRVDRQRDPPEALPGAQPGADPLQRGSHPHGRVSRGPQGPCGAHPGSRGDGGWHLLVTARYVVVCTSPAALRAKHWNMPVSSGSSPLICRLPSARSWKRESFSRTMRAASLYQAISGGGTPARAGATSDTGSRRHGEGGWAAAHLWLGRGWPPPSPSRP